MGRSRIFLVITSLAVLSSVPMAQSVHARQPTGRSPQPEICATYLGVKRCVVTREPAPKKPETTPGMQAVTSPGTIRSDGTVTFTAGGRPGGRGFTVGEIVRLFEFRNGKVSEMINARFADSKGSITTQREILSLPGVNNDGLRILCARGERSLRMACDSYNIGSTTSTTQPARITSGPKQAKTSSGLRAKAARTQVSPGQTTKITFSPLPGKKGFKPGEKIVFYDFFNGGRETIDSGKAAPNGGVTLTIGWRDGATVDGTHELCSYGITSKMMACYTLTTVDFRDDTPAPSTTAAPGASSTTTTSVPGSSSTTSTTQPYGPPVAR